MVDCKRAVYLKQIDEIWFYFDCSQFYIKSFSSQQQQHPEYSVLKPSTNGCTLHAVDCINFILFNNFYSFHSFGQGFLMSFVIKLN